MRSNTVPKQGTDLRTFFDLMLREAGATAADYPRSPLFASAAVSELCKNYGYDISRTPIRTQRTGRPLVAYRIEGKWTKNGTYIALRNKK